MTSPLEAAREIAPRAAALAAEAEAERRLPATLSDELAEAGLYRLCVPESLGGGEAPPRELLGAVEELARGDAAAGWCVAVCATAGMLAAYLEPDAAREVFGDSAGVVGGVFAPMGRAAATGGGAHGRRALALLQQRRQLRLADGRLRRPRRRRAAAAGKRPARHPPGADALRRGRGDRHLVGVRAAGDRQPRHRGRGARGPRRALRVAAHRRPARARPAVRVPAVRPAGGVDRRGRARDRARGARRSGGARRGQDADAEHAQARRAARDAVRRRPGRGLPARRRAPCCTRASGRPGRRRSPARRSRSSCARGCGWPRPTRSRRRPRRSTPRTRSRAAPRSTRRARSSAASATCTRRRSTCSSARRRGS